MVRSYSILMIIFLFLSVCIATAGDAKKDAKEKDASSCDCYKTEAIKCTDFLTEDDKFIKMESKCKKGYFVSGITQSAENDPHNFGQYILIESIECCKPCQE